MLVIAGAGVALARDEISLKLGVMEGVDPSSYGRR